MSCGVERVTSSPAQLLFTRRCFNEANDIRGFCRMICLQAGRWGTPREISHATLHARFIISPAIMAHMSTQPKNTICLWYEKDAQAAAEFYAATFPDSSVGAIFRAPSDFPDGKAGDVLTVLFTVCGIPCIGLNGGPTFKQSEAFSFQIATDTQEETDRYWNAIV